MSDKLGSSGGSGNGRRVLFCIGSHNTWGGIELWLSHVCSHLVSNGWHPVVGLARGKKFNEPAKFRHAHPGLETIEFDGRTGTPEGRACAIELQARRLRPHLMVPIGLADGFVAAARLKREGQVVRVLAPLRATSPELLGDISMFAPIIDFCVGNNPLHARYLRESGVLDRERIATIVNGVALADRASADFNRKENSLLFVGRLHRLHKRILDLPQVLDELQRLNFDFRLTIVGDGEGREELLRGLQGRIASGQVRFLGYLPPEQIASEILPRHAMLMHFSAPYGEGCPQVLQQALAHGVVPVCSEFLGLHSLGFLRDGVTCRIFPTGDYAGAADRIVNLARDALGMARISRAGRDAIAKFPMREAMRSWESALEKTLDLPVRYASPQFRRHRTPPARSRLERAGVPPRLADRARRMMRRFPDFPDGWAEWPGTLAALVPSERSAMLAELYRLDAAARPMEDRTIEGA